MSEVVAEREPSARDRMTPAEVVAGFLAAAAMAVAFPAALNIELSLAGASLDFRPIRLGVPAELLALLAVGLGSGRSRLPAFALAFCTLCWVLGMVVAVLTDRPLY